MKMDLTLLGIGIIFIGIIIVFFGALSSSGKGDSKVAIGGIVGFIPFGFWSDDKMKGITIGIILISILIIIILNIFSKL